MKRFKIVMVTTAGKETLSVDEEKCSRILEELDLDEIEFFQIRVRSPK